jgi:hypothetical protein
MAGRAWSSITVTAVDALGNPIPGFIGTVRLSSSDPRANRFAGLPVAVKADIVAEVLRDHAAALPGAFSVVSPGLVRIRHAP